MTSGPLDSGSVGKGENAHLGKPGFHRSACDGLECCAVCPSNRSLCDSCGSISAASSLGRYNKSGGRHLCSRPISRGAGLPFWLNCAVYVRHIGQPHCPCRDWFVFPVTPPDRALIFWRRMARTQFSCCDFGVVRGHCLLNQPYNLRAPKVPPRRQCCRAVQLRRQWRRAG
jgi:hypothetical protein